VERLEAASAILQVCGNYGGLTGHGSFVALNDSIEFAATCFSRRLTLFFSGAGIYLSRDYWSARRWRHGS
jgi:putative oxidoreductase